MSDYQIHQFRCLSDNYGVLLHDPATGATAAIDAPEEAAVTAALGETGWTLSNILITHHHDDHTAGIAALKAATGARVTGPEAEADKIAGLDATVSEGDTVEVGRLRAEVIATPGHTLGHIAYSLPAEKLLFAADTLFALGCGRVFEGTPADMWGSLKKLRALPGDTLVYFGHEYTESNARFALSVDPDNAALAAYAEKVKRLRADGQSTMPTTIADEIAANPFLRADDEAFAARLGLAGADPVAVFAEIRGRKDRF